MSAGIISGTTQTSSGNFEYDLVVIGGGSGGLACSKRAASFGKKVVVLDFVVPSPAGSQWGLGGTCVNVGCIPKKLMHTAALLGHNLIDAQHYGWTGISGNASLGEISQLNVKSNFSWEKLVSSVQDHIGSLNWQYKTDLRSKNVKYINAYGKIIDAHTIAAFDKKNKETIITTNHIVIATGGRPTYPDIPGKQFGISSDDLFSLPQPPNKTLIIGASYIALECAGFLAGLGFDVTVMVRSILLRGFDQQMAEEIGSYMQASGVKFLREFVPVEITENPSGSEYRLSVHYKNPSSDQILVEPCDTVLFAIGRNACTDIGLSKIGVKINPHNKKIISTHEQTNIPNIFAIGDVLDGKPELTPVAIKAGRFLANRLYGNSQDYMDYQNIATTVFTPLEYGVIGFSEEDAIRKYGPEDIEIYHSKFFPLEWTVAHGDPNACYCKLITVKSLDELVVGLHYLGPHAGEVIQGFSLAFRLKATKKDFDSVVGIHPTCAELFLDLHISKSSGIDPSASGC
eukprot:Sdes_comp19950_c0_seq1m12451